LAVRLWQQGADQHGDADHDEQFDKGQAASELIEHAPPDALAVRSGGRCTMVSRSVRDSSENH
jgi:hypothetical protein